MRGPGKYQDRIRKLERTMPPEQVRVAYDLARALSRDTAALAYYILSLRRQEDSRRAKLSRYQQAIASLSAAPSGVME